jgi:hypothetical protein
MILTTRQPVYDNNNQIVMGELPIENVAVSHPSILAIDGSTTNSGLALVRGYDGALLYTMSAKREKKTESPVHYKIRLKRAVADLLRRNKQINQIFYEEPIVENISAVSNLFMLRAFVEEMIIENEPEFNHIKNYEVSNMRWKKEFLAPDKVPVGTDRQKEAVRNKILKYLPFLDRVSQDEIDATAIGWVASLFSREGARVAEELESKKKARAFQYNVEFIGADDDDAMLNEFMDTYRGPKKLMEVGVGFSSINKRENFDRHIYESMGDSDKLLIVKMESSGHGNIVLQHKIGNLAAQYDYIYSVVWRKTRKY